MSTENNNQQPDQFNDLPIITYSNRIQKHLFELTQMIATDHSITMTEKRRLRLLIANLPPQAKETFAQYIKQLEDSHPMSTTQFFIIYSNIHDWVYKNILQDAFKAKPSFGRGKL